MADWFSRMACFRVKLSGSRRETSDNANVRNGSNAASVSKKILSYSRLAVLGSPRTTPQSQEA